MSISVVPLFENGTPLAPKKSKIGQNWRLKMAKKTKLKKTKPEKVDGLSPENIKMIRIAIRQVWSWSHPRKLCLARAVGKDGFSRCEECKQRVPKVYADHIINVGDVDGGFIARLFCPSSGLQALCKKCHDAKTKAEKQRDRLFSDLF